MGENMMKAILTTGNGDYDKLVYTDVPMPEITQNEVLIKVLAAGINNTEINTRLGWYSSSVSEATDKVGKDADTSADGGWDGATPFPIIQGTDCCGEIINAENRKLIGKRVIVRSCMRETDFTSLDNIWMASNFDGAFAQYVKVPTSEAFPINCDWTDAELGSIPCAYGTSENMLERAQVKKGDVVLVTGASGGVGSATAQLAKRRGAKVVAIASLDKHSQMDLLGIDKLLGREANLLDTLGEQSIDVVVDNVAGSGFPTLLKLLKRGGRYVSSGAIAGPIVELDMRDMYLKDIALIGTTAWDECVFPNLVGYIERNEIKPLVAKTFPLADIVEAQKEFLTKKHVGKFVLIPQHP